MRMFSFMLCSGFPLYIKACSEDNFYMMIYGDMKSDLGLGSLTIQL